jgi:2-oxoisovalerate dehydrogenase E1 component alpha subunit
MTERSRFRSTSRSRRCARRQARLSSRMAIPQGRQRPSPPVDVRAHDIHDLAYSIMRVLDPPRRGGRPWAQGLDPDGLKNGLRAMMKTRAYDARMMMAQRQGKTSFYMPVHGEEAVACGFQTALGEGDMNFPTYRQQGLLIAQDWPLSDMMCQVFSNAQDRLLGRQLPVLYSAREAGFFSISATSPPIRSGRWAGRWPRRSAATRGSPRPGSARARPPRATSTRPLSSPRSTGRR